MERLTGPCHLTLPQQSAGHHSCVLGTRHSVPVSQHLRQASRCGLQTLLSSLPEFSLLSMNVASLHAGFTPVPPVSQQVFQRLGSGVPVCPQSSGGAHGFSGLFVITKRCKVSPSLSWRLAWSRAVGCALAGELNVLFCLRHVWILAFVGIHCSGEVSTSGPCAWLKVLP